MLSSMTPDIKCQFLAMKDAGFPSTKKTLATKRFNGVRYRPPHDNRRQFLHSLRKSLYKIKYGMWQKTSMAHLILVNHVSTV